MDLLLSIGGILVFVLVISGLAYLLSQVATTLVSDGVTSGQVIEKGHIETPLLSMPPIDPLGGPLASECEWWTLIVQDKEGKRGTALVSAEEWQKTQIGDYYPKPS